MHLVNRALLRSNTAAGHQKKVREKNLIHRRRKAALDSKMSSSQLPCSSNSLQLNKILTQVSCRTVILGKPAFHDKCIWVHADEWVHFFFLHRIVHGSLLTAAMTNIAGCRNWMDAYELDASMNYPEARDFMEKCTILSCVTDFSSLKLHYKNNKKC